MLFQPANSASIGVREKPRNVSGVWKCDRKGKVCKVIGPSTRCFCDHELRQHSIRQENPLRMVCGVDTCRCPNFSYVNSQGNMQFLCNCGHSHKLHDPISKRCMFLNCGACNRGFQTAKICANCSTPFMEHSLVLEIAGASEAPYTATSENSKNNIVPRAQQNDHEWRDEDITEDEINRRKATKAQVFKYPKKTSAGETLEDEDDGEEQVLRIKKQWNPDTIFIKDNGVSLDVRSVLKEQERADKLLQLKQPHKSYEDIQRDNSKKDILRRVNEKALEERMRIERKYGVINERENDEEGEKEEEHFIPALHLFYKPNRFALEIIQLQKKIEILQATEANSVFKIMR